MLTPCPIRPARRGYLRSARRTMAVVALAVGAVLVGFSTPPASALVTQTDSVKVDSDGFDLAGEGSTDGTPHSSAELEWDHAWFSVVPRLQGLLHFDDVAGQCTRVRMTSYDVYGQSTGVDISDRECANTNAWETDVIQERGHDGLLGQAGAASVKIVLQHETPNGWERVGAPKTKYYGPIIDTDTAFINGPEIDVGTGDFLPSGAGGHPQGPASVTWASTGGPIRPTLVGNLYMVNADDICGRVRLQARDDAGTVLHTETSTALCATSDDLTLGIVQLDDFASNSVADVQVTVQRRGGTGQWQNGQTVTLALD